MTHNKTNTKLNLTVENTKQIQMYKEVITIVEQIIKKEISMLDGASMISNMYPDIDPEYEDDDLVAFIGIASDTDKFPPKHSRHLYSIEALSKKDKEQEEMEIWAQEYGIEICHRLIQRFKDLK